MSTRGSRGRASRALLAVLAIAVTLAGVEFYALTQYGRPHRTAPTPAAPAPATPAPAPAPALGWIDRPAGDTLVGPVVTLDGWALDRAGVAAVEVRVAGQRFPAAIGRCRHSCIWAARSKPAAGPPGTDLPRCRT